jgi:stage II sporulation protein D
MMRLRTLGVAEVAAAAVMQSCQPACTPPPPAPPPVTTAPPTTPPPPPPPPTSVTIAGQGNGHGRGLSAWGAYGMAVRGSTWLQIIDTYYGGTAWANAGDRTFGVRLLWADARPDVTVISTRGAATWSGAPGRAFGALHAFQVGPNRYDVYGASGTSCAGGFTRPGVAFVRLAAGAAGPIDFATTVDPASAAPGDVLGVCRPDGSVTHYRGVIRAVTDGTTNRTVNLLPIELYLRGVLSREVSTSWGNAANGAGMNALWSMAVAARSFAHAQNRYPQYGAQTCDTAMCQVYGGAAFRRAADAPTSFPTATQVCETGNLTFECANTTRAVRETTTVVRVRPRFAGDPAPPIISGEYSATHGPYSSGINFPRVDDSVSRVPGNSLYTWSRTVSVADIVRTYPQIGTFTGAHSERDPASTASGVWGNRVVLEGTAGTVVVSNLAFRTAFRFPSHAFSVARVE